MRVTWSGVWWWCLDFFPGVWRKNQIALNFSTQVSTLTSGTHLSMFSSALLFYGEVPTPHRNILFTELYVFQPFSKVRLRDQRPENIARPPTMTLFLSKGRMPLYLNFVGQFIMVTLVGIVGLILYAFYKDCDPVLAGVVAKRDAVVPLFVLQQFTEKAPGVCGIFISCLFSGALSTLDSAFMPWHQWRGKKSRDLTDFKV